MLWKSETFTENRPKNRPEKFPRKIVTKNCLKNRPQKAPKNRSKNSLNIYSFLFRTNFPKISIFALKNFKNSGFLRIFWGWPVFIFSSPPLKFERLVEKCVSFQLGLLLRGEVLQFSYWQKLPAYVALVTQENMKRRFGE